MHASLLVFCSDPKDVDGFLEPYHFESESDQEFQVEIFAEDIQRNFDNDITLKDKKYWREKMDEYVRYKTGKPEDYLMEFNGYEKDEDGNLGYWTNPNARMDWSEIGGRWSDELQLKKTNKNNPKKGVDIAKVSAVDWEKTKNHIAEMYGKGYDAQFTAKQKKEISRKEYVEQHKNFSMNFHDIFCEEEGWIDEPDEQTFEDKIKYWSKKGGWVVVVDYHQ